MKKRKKKSFKEEVKAFLRWNLKHPTSLHKGYAFANGDTYQNYYDD